MLDKKFMIAIGIIVILGVALLYVAVVGPKIQGYFDDKQIQAQAETVQAILQIVEQQGYVAIGDGADSVVLVRYQPPQQGQEVVQDNGVGTEQLVQEQES